LFSAKSVEFEIEPPGPDGFDIDGGWFRLPIGERTLLRKGTYTVNVRKQGYYDVNQSFVVGDEQSMTLSLRMRKKPGKLLDAFFTHAQETRQVTGLRRTAGRRNCHS
jgi:hypothetical protein